MPAAFNVILGIGLVGQRVAGDLVCAFLGGVLDVGEPIFRLVAIHCPVF